METPEFVDGNVSFVNGNETFEGIDISHNGLYEHEACREESNISKQGEVFQFFQPQKREEGQEEGVALIKEYLEKCPPNTLPNHEFMSFLRGDSVHSQQGHPLSLSHDDRSLSLQGPLSEEELGAMVQCLSDLKWNRPMGLSLGGALSDPLSPQTPLFRWLGDFQFCVKELVLSSTQLTDVALKSLLDSLEHSRTLQLLDISNNFLTEKSTPNLSSFLGLSCMKEKEGREYPNVPLRSLNISGNQLGDNGIATLFSFSSPSSFSSCLERVTAESVGMEGKGVEALAKFVRERAPLLHSLDLGGNQIGDEGCLLLDLLPCVSVEGRVGGVWRLGLRGNMLGENFGLRCAHLFQNSPPCGIFPSISSISRPLSSLVEVNLGDNNFSPSVALGMLRALSLNSWVTLFDLQNVNLGKEGIGAVEELLLNNSVLTHLVVDAIFEKGGEVVADALEKNTTVLDINFGDQQFILQPVLDRVQGYLLRNRQRRKTKKDENLERRVQKLEREVEELKKEQQRGKDEVEALKREQQLEREEAEERWREREEKMLRSVGENEKEGKEMASSFVSRNEFAGLVLQIIQERERVWEGEREEEKKRMDQERGEQQRRAEEERRLREEERERFERELEELRKRIGEKGENDEERKEEGLVGLKERIGEMEKKVNDGSDRVGEMERKSEAERERVGGELAALTAKAGEVERRISEERERTGEELEGLRGKMGEVERKADEERVRVVEMERKGEVERKKIGGELAGLAERMGEVERRAGEERKSVGEEERRVGEGELLGLRERVNKGFEELREKVGEVERKGEEEKGRVDKEFEELRERVGEVERKGEQERRRIDEDIGGAERRRGEEKERVDKELEGLKKRAGETERERDEEKVRIGKELKGLRERDEGLERKSDEGERRVMREVEELVKKWELVERAVREGQKEKRGGKEEQRVDSSFQASLAEAMKDFSPQKLSHPTKSRPMVARRDLLKILQEKVGNNEKRLRVLEENKENNNSDNSNRFDLLMKEMAKTPHHINGGGGMGGGMGGGVTHEVLEQRLRSIDHSLRSDLLCELGRVEADLYNTLQQDLHHVDARISSAFLCISTLGADREREKEREREREKGRTRGEGREGERRNEVGEGLVPPPKAHHDLFSTPLAQQQYQKQLPPSTPHPHHQPPFPSPPSHSTPPSSQPPSTPLPQFEGLSLDAFLSLSNDVMYHEHFHSAKKDRHSTPSEMGSRGPVVSEGFHS